MATLSVTQAFALVEFTVKKINNISTDNRLFMGSTINRELREILKDTNPNDLISSSTISVIGGTQSYSLPADFESMDDNNCGLFETDSNGDITDEPLNETGVGSQETGYRIEGSNLILTPNQTTNKTLILRYIPTLVKFTALTDTFVVSDRFEDLVRLGLLREHAIFDRDAATELQAAERYSSALDEFIRIVNKTPKVVSLIDISSAY